MCNLILVLPSIKLNDYSLLNTDKIGYVSPNRMLAAKPMALKLPIPQCLPKQALGICHFTA